MSTPTAAPDRSSEETGRQFRPRAIAGVAIAAIIAAWLPLPLPPEAHRTLVVLVVAGGLWITESLPIAVTALLIPVLGITLGAADARHAFAGFGDPIVFLFFGTFLLTDAADHHGLNARLARGVIASRWVQGGSHRLLWAIALLGCAISAWVNNTATTAMLLPLALSAERFGSPRLLTGVLLMAAYAPSLGGLATPVGTAPNLIGLRLLEEATGHRPSFAQWSVVFAPLAILSTALTAWWLSVRAGRVAPASRPAAAGAPVTASGATMVNDAPRAWSLAERTLIPVFVLTVLLWITPGILAATPLSGTGWVKAWQQRLPEPAVPLLAALCLFVLPARASRGADHPAPRILDVGVFRRVDWSTILLFGGGLSLGAMMFESGLARALGEAIFGVLPTHSSFGICLASALMAVLVSEMTSNTASAALVVPVVLALAQAAGMDPVKPALAATVGCSFGFMLPVSTPPNVLVYSTGRVPLRAMMSNGLLLDAVGVLLVAGWVTLFA